MRAAGTVALLGLALGAGVAAIPVEAGDVHGNAQVVGGTVERDDEESDVTEQDYRLSWFRPLTPWLSFNLTYRYSKDRTVSATTAERAQSTPEFVLLYNRTRFTARLSLFEQRTTGTASSNNFDRRSALAYVSYRPEKGPKYTLQYRDESNVADVSVFGRDSESTNLQFDTIYDTENWGIRFSHQNSDIDNTSTGFGLDQTRNQLRANYMRRWRDGDYTLSAETWISQVKQSQVAPTGSMLAQPVPAVDGLFDIDLTPSFGTLASKIDLVDGDTDAAVDPPIDIGGALTGNNIGVDLGVTRPVSRLEITVDTLSDASLLWEVYQSPDNFNWTPVGGIAVIWDDVLTRYTLQFPEATDRYFKAVNVSVNSFANVLVTEIRALVDVDELGRRSADSKTYRLDLLSSLKPHDLVRGTVHLFLGNDESLASLGISQEIDQFQIGTNWTVDLGHNLKGNANLRYSEFEQSVAPMVRRDVRHHALDLTWDPLETVRGIFEVSRHDESDDGAHIRTSEQVRARISTQIYPALLLTSEVSRTIVDDDASGFDQSVIRWVETMESDPLPNWRIGGSAAISWFDSVGIVTVSRRVGVELFTTWRIAPYLTFGGQFGLSDDDFTENQHQRYTLSWAPGRKFGASIYFQDSDAVDTRRVTTEGVNLSYRPNRRLLLFASASRSETEDLGVLTTEVTNARLGLRATF